MAIGEVSLSLGGRDRVFRFRLKAWSALEDQGYSLDQIIESMQSGRLNLKVIHALLWAMLQHENPKPSMDDVGEWVGGENVELMVEKLGEAIKDAFPHGNGSSPPVGASPAAGGTGFAPENSPAVSG